MAEEKPASKKDIKDTIGSLISAQELAAEKRLKADQIKSSADKDRLEEIKEELKKANATKTLELEQEKLKIAEDSAISKSKEGSGKRAIEIQKSALELQKTSIEATGGVATDNKEYRLEQLRIRGEELALRKQNATSPAALKEIKNEEKKLRDDRFKEFLGEGSTLSKGIGFLSTKLGNLKGAAGSIFGTLVTVAALGALAAFLQSETWKNLKDKIIPLLAKGLESFKKSFGEFVTDITAFFEDPSFSSLIDIFTGESGGFVAALAGIVLLLSPLRTLLMLSKGVRLFVSTVGAIASAFMNLGGGDGGPMDTKRGRGPGGKARIGRGLLRGILSGAKFIPGIGLAVTAAFALFDGIPAAIEEYRKSGSYAKALQEGVSAAISGITFGLIAQEDISDFITNEIDIANAQIDAIGQAFKNFGKAVADDVVPFYTKYLGPESQWDKDFIKASQDLVTDSINWFSELGKKIRKTGAEMEPPKDFELKIPKMPDFGKIFMDLIRKILAPIVNFRVGAAEDSIFSKFGGQPIKAAMKAAGFTDFVNFVDQTGSFTPPPPARSAESIQQSEIDRFLKMGQGGSAPIIIQQTSNNVKQGDKFAFMRSIPNDALGVREAASSI